MIANYWSPQPQGFYVPKGSKPLAAAHLPYGLGDSDIITSTMLWNLLSATSRLLFVWESKRVDPDDCPGAFPTLEHAKKDMWLRVGGRYVHDYTIGTFTEFYQAVMSNPVGHLNLTKHQGGEDQLRFVVRSRWLAKEKALGKGLSTEEEAILDIACRNVWYGAH